MTKWIELGVDLGKAAWDLIASAIRTSRETQERVFEQLSALRDKLRADSGKLAEEIAAIEQQSDERMDALEQLVKHVQGG